MMPPASDRTRPSGFPNLITQSCTAGEQLNLYMDRGSPAFNVQGRRDAPIATWLKVTEREGTETLVTTTETHMRPS